MKHVLFVLALFTAVVSAQSSQNSLEAYAKLPSKSLMAISPSGNRLAYRDTKSEQDVVVVIDLKKGELLGAIDVSEVQPTGIAFVNDERLIFKVMSEQRMVGYRGRYNVGRAYAFNLKDNSIHQLLTRGFGIYEGQTQLGNIVGISPDKQFAYMTAYKNPGQFSLYKVDLANKRLPRLYQKGTGDTINFFLDVEGNVIARERFNNDNDLHTVEARRNDEWVEVFSDKTDIPKYSFDGLTPDRKSLLTITTNLETGTFSVYELSLADGSLSDPIFEHTEKDVETLVKGLDQVVHGVKFSGFKPSYEFFDQKLNARMAGLAKALPNNTFTISDFSDNWNEMILFMDGELSAGDLVLYKNGGINLLGSAREEINPELVYPVSEFSIEARDGTIIPTLLTLPLRKANKALPVIMFPHGGPRAHDTMGFNWMAQFLASKGYAVIQPQFRGSSGFGVDHILKGRGQWGTGMQYDLVDTLTYFANKGIVNKEKACIVGMSYGGYAALSGISKTPDVYQCAVSINGVSDLNRMLEVTQRQVGEDHWVMSYWHGSMANGMATEEYLDTISPVNDAKNVIKPVLLIHGSRDKVVPYEQSKRMLDALKEADKEVTYIELDGAGHNFYRERYHLEVLNALDAFLTKHI